MVGGGSGEVQWWVGKGGEVQWWVGEVGKFNGG